MDTDLTSRRLRYWPFVGVMAGVAIVVVTPLAFERSMSTVTGSVIATITQALMTVLLPAIGAALSFRQPRASAPVGVCLVFGVLVTSQIYRPVLDAFSVSRPGFLLLPLLVLAIAIVATATIILSGFVRERAPGPERVF